MSLSETIVTNRQDPAIEAYRLGLLQDVQGFTGGQIFGQNVQNLRKQGLSDQQISDRLSTAATGTEGEEGYNAGRTYSLDEVSGINQNAQYAPPDYQIAGLSPSEQTAINRAQQGVGSYQPYLDRGDQSIRSGISSLYGTGAQFDPTNARNFANQGIAAYGQTTAGYDPASAKAYMNEYEDAAVQQALADVARAGQVQQAQLGANAVSSGAFGGARQGIQESELGRNTLMQQGRTAAQMRAAGYESAAQRSQQAFEQQMARKQAAAQNSANLGMSAEQFAATGMENAMARRQAQASGYGQLGIQQAGLGEMRANLGSMDLQNLMGTGALERGNRQAGLDALRLSNLQRYTQPYQQYGFLSDIYSGTPSGSSTLTAASAPQTSPFQSMLGLGIAGLSAAGGAQKAGLL